MVFVRIVFKILIQSGESPNVIVHHIEFRIDNPLELGSDRLVNAIAAYERFESACVSLDFGASWKAEAQGVPAKPVTSASQSSGMDSISR